MKLNNKASSKKLPYLVLAIALSLVISLGLVGCGEDSLPASGSVTTQAATTLNVTSNSTLASNTTAPALATATVSLQPESLTPTGNLEVDIQNVVDRVKAGVVLITVETSQGEAAGTGSIITPDGYILTNAHVVYGATQVTVVRDNGQSVPARLVGTANDNDLAVVKIDGTNLPAIPLGSSSDLKVGQWVVAVGNALALPGGPTVTAGIVGAIGRSLEEPQPLQADLTDLIQTSAAINPGNSGGPLLSLKGQIVGINTAAPVDSESQTAAQGIGFAISIDQAQPIIQSLIAGTPVIRPYMGVSTSDLTPGLVARYRLPVKQGIIITEVQTGSPAAQAGMRRGQVITQMDGTQINSQLDLKTVLNRHKPGEAVPVTMVNQNGQQLQANITFGQSSVR
jgi:S1-C subfamily serine protease